MPAKELCSCRIECNLVTRSTVSTANLTIIYELLVEGFVLGLEGVFALEIIPSSSIFDLELAIHITGSSSRERLIVFERKIVDDLVIIVVLVIRRLGHIGHVDRDAVCLSACRDGRLCAFDIVVLVVTAIDEHVGNSLIVEQARVELVAHGKGVLVDAIERQRVAERLLSAVLHVGRSGLGKTRLELSREGVLRLLAVPRRRIRYCLLAVVVDGDVLECLAVLELQPIPDTVVLVGGAIVLHG